MSKLKRVIVSVLVLLSCTSFVFASNINMNLASGNETIADNQTAQNSVNANSNNETSSITNGTTNTTGNVNNSMTNYNSNSNSMYTNSSTNMETAVQSVNNINDVGSSSLEIGQIINILLVAVGFILILLAIAILVRMKK